MGIETERLLLRPYNDNDFEFLVSLLTNPEMVRFIGNGQTRDRAGAKEFFDWILRTYESGPDIGLMMVRRKNDHTPIGHAVWRSNERRCSCWKMNC